jgi:hypothetical protein
MMCKFQIGLVGAYEDYNCFDEVSFSFCRRLQNGTKQQITFCKIKEIATEMFDILKSAKGEECLSATSVFEWHTGFKQGRESLQGDERKGRHSSY